MSLQAASFCFTFPKISVEHRKSIKPVALYATIISLFFTCIFVVYDNINNNTHSLSDRTIRSSIIGISAFFFGFLLTCLACSAQIVISSRSR